MCEGCGYIGNYIVMKCQYFCATTRADCEMTTIGWVAIAVLIAIIMSRIIMDSGIIEEYGRLK